MIKHAIKTTWISFVLALLQPIFVHSNRRLINQLNNQSNKLNRIPVYFVVTQMDVWLNSGLLRHLQRTEEFECSILIFPDFESPIEDYCESVRNCVNECAKRGLSYINCWDEVNNCIIVQPSQLERGYIFYEQPTKFICQGWDVSEVRKNHLILYFPYGMLLANLPKLHYRLEFYFYCHRIFVESIPRKVIFLFHRPMLYKKIKVTGFPKSDLIFGHLDIRDIREKFTGTWAPHWSVSHNSIISVSSFLRIADDMLLIAQKNPDIHFKFRPHPRLKHELRNAADQPSLSQFIKTWNDLPNTTVIYGSEYSELLHNSDFLITDSLSFLYEFLSTGNPTLITTSRKNQSYNLLGRIIASTSYRALDAISIEDFIAKFRQGVDPLLKRRLVVIDFLKKVTARDSSSKIATLLLQEMKR